MPTQIAAIQPRQKNWRVQANADWLDSMLVWRSGAGGVVAGAGNVGTGALAVSDVGPGTALGAHVVTITSIDGMARFTVENPAGAVTARGVVGLPCYAGGIMFTLSPGPVPFAIGDGFAIGVLPIPVDITGLRFVLQARLTPTTANLSLSADSAPPDGSDPTIATGGASGALALYLFADALSAARFPPGLYVYDMLAIDPESGRRVVAFYGTIEQVQGVTLLP